MTRFSSFAVDTMKLLLTRTRNGIYEFSFSSPILTICNVSLRLFGLDEIGYCLKGFYKRSTRLLQFIRFFHSIHFLSVNLMKRHFILQSKWDEWAEYSRSIFVIQLFSTSLSYDSIGENGKNYGFYLSDIYIHIYEKQKIKKREIKKWNVYKIRAKNNIR